jgi:N-acylneuraminate cytidylyltransferase/CMP-N,N'-diacetyllegionaminic acid synthase
MLAIIPARGGSKGFPRKNIRLLGAKPLIQWTIEAALNSKMIDRVILSTDDEEIAEICKPLGIEIPFLRPKYLAEDDSLAIDNYIYTMDRLTNEFSNIKDEFIVLLPTSPFRDHQDIDSAIEMFYNTEADSLISCCELEHPIEWTLSLNKNSKILDINSKNLKNRQDYVQRYKPNGAMYVLKTSNLKKHKTYYSERSYAYVMEAEKSIDIDTSLDFYFAEFLINKK